MEGLVLATANGVNRILNFYKTDKSILDTVFNNVHVKELLFFYSCTIAINLKLKISALLNLNCAYTSESDS